MSSARGGGACGCSKETGAVTRKSSSAQASRIPLGTSGSRLPLPTRSSAGSRSASATSRTGIPSSKSVSTKVTVDPQGRTHKITTVTERFEPQSADVETGDICPGASQVAVTAPSNTKTRANIPKVGPCRCSDKLPQQIGGRPSYNKTSAPNKGGCCCAKGGGGGGAGPSSQASYTKTNAPKKGPCACSGKKAEQPTFGPRARPADYQSPAGPASSLEKVVEQELLQKSMQSPGSRVHAQSMRSKGSSPPVLMTPEGPVQGTHQMTMTQTVDRSADTERVKKHLAAVEVSECGCATEYELFMEDMEPGGLNTMIQDGRTRKPAHETISVTTTVLAGPDTKVQTRSAVYETIQPAMDKSYSPGEVSQMIEEEQLDIDKISRLQPPELKGDGNITLKKKLQKMQLDPAVVKYVESSIVYPPVTADDAQEETQPELLAAIMHTEEQGLNMDSAPTTVYNYLFPDAKDDILIEINPVVPGILQNVVVPAAVPSEIHVHGVTPELECAAAEVTGCGRRRPPENLYSQSVLKMGAAPEVNNTAMKGKTRVGRTEPYLVLASEEPPWEIEDIQPIINLVGGVPLKTMVREDSFEVPTYYHEMENVLEYHLVPEPPRHVSQVQLRGSQRPPWFPGYYMALPDNIKIAKSPCEVLPAAWQAVQPDIFSDDSFLIVG